MSRIIATAAIRGPMSRSSAPSRCSARQSSVTAGTRPSASRTPPTPCPVILALTGQRVERLGDLETALGAARGWLPKVPTDSLWLPYLGDALDAGWRLWWRTKPVKPPNPCSVPRCSRASARAHLGCHPARAGDQVGGRQDARVRRLRRRPAQRRNRRRAGSQPPERTSWSSWARAPAARAWRRSSTVAGRDELGDLPGSLWPDTCLSSTRSVSPAAQP